MADRSTPTLPTPSADVAELVNRLSDAESALEHSLGPGADAVLDSRGHAHLLRQAQVALQQSEERYRLLFEHAPDVIFAIAPTGAITSLNQAFETITGWPPAQWLGRSFQEFIHPDDQPLAGEMFQLVLRGERALIFELRVRTAAGGFRDVEFTGFSSQLSGGRIEAQGIGRDITERKRAEEELKKRNAFIETILVNAPIGFAVNTISDGQFMFAGRNFEKIYGVPPDSLHSVDDFFEKVYLDPVFREKIRERVMADMATGEASGMRWENIPITTLAGEHRVVTATNIPLLEQNLMISTVQDVTERWQAEAALRASEERHRLLFENNPLPMWLSDSETLRFLAVNEAAVQHYGYTREEFLAMTIEDIHPREDRPALRKFFKDRTSERTRSSESRHRRKDGTIIQVEVISRSLVFDGRPARLVLVSDITEKKLFEEKFLHAQRLESIGMLASGIAHDLNNVLAPIMFAAPLLRGSLSTPRDLKILDTLEQCAERGAGLVKQILGFAHSATGQFRATQVKHLLRDISSLIEETFPKSIQLEHQIPSNLWPVMGNATQIHQVLMNLCVNARDAMPSGGSLRIVAANRWLDAAAASAISDGQPGAWLVLEVTDTGTGIAPEVLERIWTPFFTTKGIGKGTGLGLSTVRGIVLSHHGFVELDTKVGRGTTFRVFLPAIESEATRPSSASPFALPDGHGELILVVDDDKAIRDMVAEILGDHGYRVLICADGVEALTLINNRPGGISIVITDADMPRLDGVALVRAVLKMRPDIRLLAISGLSPNETGAPNLPEIQKLAHAFLTKPFKPEDLLGAIHGLLHPPEKT